MSLHVLQDNPACQYYHMLLQRYARRIIKDDSIAATLARQVLAEQSGIGALRMDTTARQVLATATRFHCYCWQQSQVFDRPVIKTTDITFK